MVYANYRIFGTSWNNLELFVKNKTNKFGCTGMIIRSIKSSSGTHRKLPSVNFWDLNLKLQDKRICFWIPVYKSLLQGTGSLSWLGE